MPKQITARQWLDELVSMDTTSRNSNLMLIERVQSWLEEQGAICQQTRNPEGTKANLFATLPTQDGVTEGGLVLSGHTDVVPVDGQSWDTDPFKVHEADGRLYGRGVADMKGFIAVALALVPEFMRMNRKRPIHLALSFDEEIGCAGAPYMIEELRARGIKLDGCVVGEPSSMKVVVAHKGINMFRCSVHGKAAHSSLTNQGCNAIEHAASLICKIREIAATHRRQGPYDNDYDVPYTTLSTNQIQGGIAVNTVPELCEFTYEFRNLPGMNADELQSQIESYIQQELLPGMRSEHAEADVVVAASSRAPGLSAEESAEITKLVRALTQDNETRKVAYGTEAGLFQSLGVPTVICGPGNIEQAHKANEFIDIEQLEECERFLRKMASTL